MPKFWKTALLNVDQEQITIMHGSEMNCLCMLYTIATYIAND